MSAFLHQKERVSFQVSVDGSVQEYCIANEADLLIGMSLFESVRETTVTGLPQCVLDFYENVVMPLSEVTYRAMMDQYTEYYGRTISQVHLKNKFSDPLVSTGYLFRDEHPVDKRMKIFDKLVTEENMKKKQECQPFVLKNIFSADELHEYIHDIKKVQNDEIAVGTDDSWFYTQKKLR
jgi:hypothetical protein